MADQKIEGVYYEDVAEKVRYWARDAGGGIVSVEFLRPDGTSTGMVAERVPAQVFQQRFVKDDPSKKRKAEPPKTPQQAMVEKCMAAGQAHLDRKEFHSAEFEFKTALKFDEKDVGASYGLGESYLGQGKMEEARRILSRLTDNDRLYTKAFKHVFNKLGFLLRRQGLFPLALKYYERAIKIDHTDPVLFYNLARVLYEMQQKEKAAGFLKNALAIDPGFREAADFLANVEKQGQG
ncbi:MAG: tetratricopeptide repeat protein [Candidatus Tectomicrobia bacterium]|uniref:Tetratricopeptide repeat protein n=1 Tax=Tectimicrobiota bacterium TaxID=2528274 RepID=A0A933E8E6_UNCTE|nr:tetratricopeptide repeat protein [Candidatus Tectomicrobia bacterium]